MRKRGKERLPAEPVEVEVERLAHDGRGVAHVEGKTLFIHGALAGERVRARYIKRQRNHDEGIAEEILRAAPDRVPPRCAHFERCGGCSLQHLAEAAQIRDKQQILLESLRHIGKVEPMQVLPPLQPASHWGYRKKARLGVKHVLKKGRVLVGFREKGSPYLAELERCLVLDPKVGELLQPLADLIAGLSIVDQIPQIEVAMGDAQTVLVFRVLAPPSEADRLRLCDFGRIHGLTIAIQPGGQESIVPLCGADGLALHYAIPEFHVEYEFLPGDFTQVNSDINRQMVAQAVTMLEPGPQDRVLDLFCGLGNFTLPLARRAGHVTGVEGEAGLVARARGNAERNALQEKTAFFTANLYEPLGPEPWLQQRFNKALLDPPRSGAAEVLEWLPRLGVEQLVYVSCYPATLARDAGVLVHQLGYRLVSAGVMDMFPHTTHVESIACFKRGKR